MTKFVIVLGAALMFTVAAKAAQQQQPQLPEGEGKALVQGTCTACHDVNQITRSSGYTREGWRELIGTMINLSGTPAGETITKYLAAHFPAKDDLKPKLVRGENSITFREWTVPTLGQRSRDPVQAPDGSIWWAGMWANLIGRIDPATGQVTEYTLPANAKPHTVTPDPQGNIWYTGNSNATIGKLDPRTGMITEYKMPDPKAKDPHTAIFDRKGIFWFTLQNSNMIGRLDPATGDIKLITAKVANSKPYGVKEDADGNLWVATEGSVARYDAARLGASDGEAADLVLTVTNPDDTNALGATDLAFDAAGDLWLTDFGGNLVFRVAVSETDVH